MNRAKWRRVTDPSILVNKLAEETGEVAKAYLDIYYADVRNRQSALANLADEFEHVEFILGRIRSVMGL